MLTVYHHLRSKDTKFNILWSISPDHLRFMNTCCKSRVKEIRQITDDDDDDNDDGDGDGDDDDDDLVKSSH